MDDLVKETYDTVQAALLNSEQEPAREIFTALCATVEFADGEGLSKAQMRSLCEMALARLKVVPLPAGTPPCFGVSHNPNDPLCAGGQDITYADEGGIHVRPSCDFFSTCGDAFSKKQVLPIAALLQKTGKKAQTHRSKEGSK